MKLYNIYRLCKLNIGHLEDINISQSQKENSINNKKMTVYTINNLDKLRNILYKIEKIPVLKKLTNEFIQTFTDEFRKSNSVQMDTGAYNDFSSKKNILYNKMNTIIELYESMGLTETENQNAIDIKLPPCEDLDEYISYLKTINFIFTQCPFLQCKDEVLKFGSVDVGSNWLGLTIAATSTCMILNNTASLLDKALTLRSHYITIQQQEEMLKSIQLKNELAEEQIKTFKQLKDAGMDIVIEQLQKEHGKLESPEEQDRVERSLDKLILFLDKGGEIYCSLDAPEDIQALFPEIQTNLELPENIIKYLEDKESQQE